MVTSGPWFVKLGRYVMGDRNPSCVVADVQTVEDARLIAAAPELLAAAKRALAWYEPRLAPGEEGPICNQLREAINKAESEET